MPTVVPILLGSHRVGNRTVLGKSILNRGGRGGRSPADGLARRTNRALGRNGLSRWKERDEETSNGYHSTYDNGLPAQLGRKCAAYR